jgi:SAM-dependent methyltransferase
MTGLTALLVEAESHPVEGWDFSWLGQRAVTKPPPWDFAAIVERAAKDADELLDLGTGGGEWLASLAVRPAHTVATEAWPPNVDVARRRLEPLGIEVVAVDAAPDNVDQPPGLTAPALPFESESFSLVVSRHESYLATEVARVLRPGGIFVTQQMGGNPNGFRAALGLEPVEHTEFDPQLATTQLEEAGLHVFATESGAATTTFADAGAFAYWLRAIPWLIEGFSILAFASELASLEQRLAADGPLSIEQPVFLVEAAKPQNYGPSAAG